MKSGIHERWLEIERSIQIADPRERNREWGRLRQEFFQQIGGYLDPPEIDISRLASLKDKYKGKRIFVIGNGPSLNRTPLHLLEGEYTFGVNRIHLLYDRINWRPSFYTAVDWRVVPDIAHEINALTGSTFFFEERYRGLLREGEDVYYYTHKDAALDLKNQQRFSTDASLGVRGAGSVVGTAVQLAFHMGFDPIYLIGCDLGYNVPETVTQEGDDVFGTGVKLHLTSTRDDDANHFDPSYFGAGSRWHDPNVERMIRGHKQCLHGVKSNNRRIYNATIGGELDIYERRNFADLFEAPAKVELDQKAGSEDHRENYLTASARVGANMGRAAKLAYLQKISKDRNSPSSDKTMASLRVLDELNQISSINSTDSVDILRSKADLAVGAFTGRADWQQILLPDDCSAEAEHIEGKFVKRIIVSGHDGQVPAEMHIAEIQVPAPGRYLVSIEYSREQAVDAASVSVAPAGAKEGGTTIALGCGSNVFASGEFEATTTAKPFSLVVRNDAAAAPVSIFKIVVCAATKSDNIPLPASSSVKLPTATTEPLSLRDMDKFCSLQNKFAGERIFIMGNGPSLNKTPLELLKNDYVFGLNRISLLFERVSWRPSFFTAFDVRVVPDNAEEFANLDVPYKFFSARYKSLLGERHNHYWHHVRGFYEGFEGCFDPTAPYFGFGGGGTIAVIATELAFFMGFREIYLIGTDVSYSVPETVKQSGDDVFGDGVKLELVSTQDDDENHFDPRYFGEGKKWHSPNVRDMKIGFARSAAYISERGGKLMNATVGGQLDEVERIDFESLF